MLSMQKEKKQKENRPSKQLIIKSSKVALFLWVVSILSLKLNTFYDTAFYWVEHEKLKWRSWTNKKSTQHRISCVVCIRRCCRSRCAVVIEKAKQNAMLLLFWNSFVWSFVCKRMFASGYLSIIDLLSEVNLQIYSSRVHILKWNLYRDLRTENAGRIKNN